MSLDRELEAYRVNKVNVVKYVKEKGLDTLSYFCSMTQFSIIIAYMYVREDFPEYEVECDRKIKLLKEFYGY
jgi:hypothetical protein